MVRSALSPATAYNWKLARLELWAVALFCALAGCLSVFKPQLELGVWSLLPDQPFTDGVFWWIAALILAAGAQVADWKLQPLVATLPTEPHPDDPLRRDLLLTSIPFLIGAYFLQAGRDFTPIGAAGWGVGLILLVAGLMPKGAFSPLRIGRSLVGFVRDTPYTALALGAIIVVAAFARAYKLNDLPGEMSSDHIEKLLDAQRILDGYPAIFFGTNGGRESFQMYFLVLLSPLTGGLNFATLKLATALESIAGIAAFYGLGQALIGDRSQRARNFGLLVALMGAVGFWHLVVTRGSLRIMLVPLVTTLLLWALIRLMRHNRRQDALWAGVLTGFGFYSYQSLRVLPLLVVLATIAGLWFYAKSAEDRKLYVKNLIISGVVAFAVFLPVFRYMMTDPESYWRRATSTVVGADFNCDEDNRIECISLDQPLMIFGENLAKTLLMFTFRGDMNWAYNAPSYPALDPVSGMFFICGLGAWLMWAVRNRDPAAVFVLVAMLVMLVPSAITLARSSEVPSANRASGAMPMVYMLVAFGAASTIRVVSSLAFPQVRRAIAVAIPAAAALAMYSYAWTLLSQPYDLHWNASILSQRAVGQMLRDFADEVGTWGNAYLIHETHLLDFRAVMIEAGEKPGDLPHTYGALEDIPMIMYENWLSVSQTRLDYSQDMLFIYSIYDPEVHNTMTAWFPGGSKTLVESDQEKPWTPSEPFIVYRVPALEEAGLIAFLRQHIDPNDATD